MGPDAGAPLSTPASVATSVQWDHITDIDQFRSIWFSGITHACRRLLAEQSEYLSGIRWREKGEKTASGLSIRQLR